MPEKMTKEEVRVAQAIEQVRIVKELVQQASAERIAYDDESEEVKVKRPKKTGEKDKTKIENNKGTHSGYGLAGESTIAKEDDEDDLRGICREKISQIQEGMYDLPKSSLEELYDALNDIVQSIL